MPALDSACPKPEQWSAKAAIEAEAAGWDLILESLPGRTEPELRIITRQQLRLRLHRTNLIALVGTTFAGIGLAVILWTHRNNGGSR